MAKQTLAERLIELRRAAGLSQVELARRAGISKAALSRLERGERLGMHQRTAQKLASALGVDLSALDVNGPSVAETRPVVGAGEPFPDEPWKMADVGELLREYMASEWCAIDKPTPEEMRFLSRIELPYKREPPDADAVHAILLSYRMRARRR